MDIAKRKTLKRIASVAAASSTGALLSSESLADNTSNGLTQVDLAENLSGLANFQVHTRISSISNDIEVVISNKGTQRTLITQMTPSQTSTSRGVFDFSKLLGDGPLELEAGKSVSVAITPHKSTASMIQPTTAQAQSLTRSLRSSFSIVTENEAYAMVDVLDGIRFT